MVIISHFKFSILDLHSIANKIHYDKVKASGKKKTVLYLGYLMTFFPAFPTTYIAASGSRRSVIHVASSRVCARRQ